eukprot:CAMPEP_0182431604 /NCGR_PEP_ID=MMETSP1167-20130531/50462_1 /TAXON_ID=2988 /ORGANISM="Mallomonas Sp, Strain CCMP3275" /LENGTH=187 /DNA_ID=CAMNT_0024618125 /DNA_START=247 /DNA_END=807 /DNA_ORIENTATION=+
MGTRPADWNDVLSLEANYSGQIQGGLGLHPWFAHNPEDDRWLDRLRSYLVSNRQMIVGEIGLDRLWKPPETRKNELDAQHEVFLAQLHLATELRRPVSIHCVKSDGIMLSILKDQIELPPALYFHSYGGSIDTARCLYNMKKYGDRMYFGFSTAVNMRSPKTSSVIASLPSNRILLESDLEAPENII